jgi:alpha-N-arabinofuranosidase
VAIADAVAARRRSAKRIMLSFDEWNVWYRTRRNRAARVKEGWPVAPPILEEIYNVEDALAFGGCCISLLNHADRITAACLAQLVNVIAPIMTETGGPAWRQTIFHPFAHFSRLGRGRVLSTLIDAPTYAARYNDPSGPIDEFFDMPEVPYLKLAAVHDEQNGLLTLFALNRSLTEELPLRLQAAGFSRLTGRQALQLGDPDLKAVNTKEHPDRVTPRPLTSLRIDGERLEAVLAPASWNVIQLAVSG